MVDPGDVELRRRSESLFSLFSFGDSHRTWPSGQLFWVATHIVPEQPVVLHQFVRQELMEFMGFPMRYINSWPEEVQRTFLREVEELITFVVDNYLHR